MLTVSLWVAGLRCLLSGVEARSRAAGFSFVTAQGAFALAQALDDYSAPRYAPPVAAGAVAMDQWRPRL